MSTEGYATLIFLIALAIVVYIGVFMLGITFGMKYERNCLLKAIDNAVKSEVKVAVPSKDALFGEGVEDDTPEPEPDDFETRKQQPIQMNDYQW